MKKNLAIALVTSLFLLNSGTGYAQAAGYYFGGAIGDSDVDVAGYDDASSWQFFGGIELTPYFALEAAYTDLGKFDVKRSDNGHIAVDGFEVNAVGNLPLTDRVSLFGELGVFAWDADAINFGTGGLSEDGTDLTLGAGMKFGLSHSLKLRFAYQIYSDVGGGDIDTLYAGASYGF